MWEAIRKTINILLFILVCTVLSYVIIISNCDVQAQKDDVLFGSDSLEVNLIGYIEDGKQYIEYKNDVFVLDVKKFENHFVRCLDKSRWIPPNKHNIPFYVPTPKRTMTPDYLKPKE